LLRDVGWFVAGVSGQRIGLIFKGRDGRPRKKPETLKWSLYSPWSVCFTYLPSYGSSFYIVKLVLRVCL